MNKRKNFLVVFSFLVAIASLLTFNGCETSRTGPEEVTKKVEVNPTPLMLNVTVVDSKTGSGVPGVLVELYNGPTKLTIVPTQSGSTFSYNIEGINATSLKVTATATGYGYSFYNARIDAAAKMAEEVRLLLDKLVTTAVNLTPTGGTVSVPSTESSAPIPNVIITVPPQAVTTNTTITVGTIPVNNVPQPPNPATTATVAVADLQPANVQFAKPITISFPLPYEAEPGEKLQLAEFVNGAWVPTVLYATVDASGLVATVNVDKTGKYCLLDNTEMSLTDEITDAARVENGSFDFPPLLKLKEILGDEQLNSGTTTRIVKTNLARILLSWIGGRNMNAFNLTYLENSIKQKYGANYVNFRGNDNSYLWNTYFYRTLVQRFDIPWPGIPANIQALRPTGDWAVFIFLKERYRTQNFTCRRVVGGRVIFNVVAGVRTTFYERVKYGDYWFKYVSTHDQGGTIAYN